MGKQLGMLVLLILMAQPVAAGRMALGVGVAVGLDYPIVQEDESQGMVFGFRGRVNVVPAIALEPNIFFTRFGDPESDNFTYDIEGSRITAYGVDAILGARFGVPGIKPYGLFGIGYYQAKQENSDGDATLKDNTDFGWSAGFGVEAGIFPSVGLDLRGKLVVITSEGGGSKKSASVIGGVNYYFGL